MAVQIAGEDPLAQGNTLARAHLAKAQRVPRGFLAFDNEGGSVAVETVGVRPDPAVLGLLEDEGESLEQLVRAQPDEFVLAGVHGGLEDTIMGSAHPAVDAIGSNDQVRIGVERSEERRVGRECRSWWWRYLDNATSRDIDTNQ